MSRAAGPGRTQKVKSQQKEEALAAAREHERLAAQERISTNTQRVAAALLHGLGAHLDRLGAQADGGDAGAARIAGWTVQFNLARVSGDPEGVQRGQRINSKDRSIAYVAPDGHRFATRDAVAAHFGIEEPVAEEERRRPPGGAAGGGGGKRPRADRAPPPVHEPPPVTTDSGQLAFEVDRVLDVRQRKRGREFLVRWVGYGCAASWPAPCRAADPLGSAAAHAFPVAAQPGG